MATDPLRATGTWYDKYPPDVILHVGTLSLVLIDSNWNWLLPSGGIREVAMSSKEVGVHPSIFQSLESLLTGPGLAGGLLKQVIVLTPSALPLIGDDGDPVGDNRHLPSAFSLSSSDRKWLFRTLSRWQQEELNHCVLVACASEQASGSGYIVPLLASSDEDEGTDSWDIDRCKLSQLSVGGLSQRPLSTFVFTDKRSLTGTSKSCGFQSVLDFVSSELSFWDVQLRDVVPFDEVTSRNAIPAQFTVCNIRSDVGDLDLSIGPVVGKITSSSVVVLLESAKNGYIAAVVYDQITSQSFETCKYMKSGIPDTFYFDGLVSGRAYEVMFFPGNCSAAQKRMKLSKYKGSFCTRWDGEKTPDSSLAMGRLFPINSSSTLPVSSLSSVSASAAPKSKGAAQAFPRDSTADTFRIVLLGANRPFWSWGSSNLHIASSSSSSSSSIEEELKDIDRMFLLEGAGLCKDVSDLCCRCWSESVDLVIHLGFNVDPTTLLQKVVLYYSIIYNHRFACSCRSDILFYAFVLCF